MCGIVGYFGKPSRMAIRMVENMWIMDVVRGYDSSGIYIVPTQGKSLLMKDTGIPIEIMRSREYSNMMKKPISTILCHNRAATIGEVTAENAHPFKAGKIIGTHNGTLISKWTFDKKSEYSTDSEALFNFIHTDGIAAAWRKLNGAASLAWYDTGLKRLNLLTNGTRPLYFAYTKDKDGVYYASESWMLRAASERCDVEISNILFPKVHNLFTFCFAKKKSKQLKVLAEVLQEYVSPIFYPYKPATEQGAKQYWPLSQDKVKDGFNETSDGKGNGEDKGKTVIPFSDNDKSYLDEGINVSDKAIDETKFLNQYKNCFYCNESLMFEYETSVIIDERTAVCGSCADEATRCGMRV